MNPPAQTRNTTSLEKKFYESRNYDCPASLVVFRRNKGQEFYAIYDSMNPPAQTRNTTSLEKKFYESRNYDCPASLVVFRRNKGQEFYAIYDSRIPPPRLELGISRVLPNFIS